ncbi:SDR family NAD(P)-dependent oxidoreductase [Marasmitruncus massiliensis]|uniref:SDR family NAD(P)-dependent oxidoreductase n=1 Tax=Marasmitruncus massiliensis TaxID=1944642 RepID=UPI0015E07103|nr:SDR family oxidoreductase [Marasmitruncus massiliensis]
MSKKIFITGAGTGIGAETSRLLAPGNELFLHYNTSVDAVCAVKEDCEKAGALKVHLLQADIMTEEACQKLVSDLRSLTDSLDVLVNNAGGMIRRQAADQLQWETMEQIFSLNAFSLFKITSLCIPLLKNGTDPNVVNISSIVIRHGGAGSTLYAAAKGAVDVFTRGLFRELAPAIRVNAVCPGVIDTPFHEKVSTPEQMQAWAQGNPLKRNGYPIHIAKAIKLCVDDDFINGETIDVNGGQMIR